MCDTKAAIFDGVDVIKMIAAYRSERGKPWRRKRAKNWN